MASHAPAHQRGQSNARAPGPNAQAGQTPDGHSTRVDVINTTGGRILCVADVRGKSGGCGSGNKAG